MALSLRYITSEKKIQKKREKKNKGQKNVNEKLHNYNYYTSHNINPLTPMPPLTTCAHNINPVTPMSPLTTCAEPWPFFHFWHHHLWSKLASSILNFCRRKAPFQWCPDQSDLHIGASELCTKMLRNWSEKPRGKLRATTGGYYMTINFPEFLNGKQAQ